ncbi:MAG TPA: class II aldolase/adducin family protein [Candidatus Koribacter sp.]|jgi:ribulose-5-phosphate 4-epimerase/fuculose-1-phosphate aldolase
MSESLKFDICCAARVLYRAGLSVANAGHISLAIGDDRMLVNRFGPSFATLQPIDILTCDFSGKIVDGEGWVNETILLHGFIHQHVPDLVALVHTHPPATVTFSAFRRVPEVYDQESCILAGDIAVVEDDYAGLASTAERVQPMADALREHRAILLPNHGAITRGPNVQLATVAMLLLEGMVQRNLSVAAAARALGAEPKAIAMEAAMTAKREISKIPFLQPLWADLLSRLRQTDAELFEAFAGAANA